MPTKYDTLLNLTHNHNSDKWAELWASFYMDIKHELIESGYAWEIDWQDDLDASEIDEQQFLRELAWVILSSGMREKIVRNKFPGISKAFFHWKSARIIRSRSEDCFKKAISIFNNKRKINAILTSVKIIIDQGLDKIMKDLKRIGPNSLKVFPLIGPATCYHLAKNVGYSTAKPDRHLVRISKMAGYNTPNQFCSDLSRITGDNASVVDVIFWRYASLNADYIDKMLYHLGKR